MLSRLKMAAKRMAWFAAKVPPLRLAMIACYELAPIGSRSSWNRAHPYDREHGLRTSRALPGYLIRPGEQFGRSATSYIPAQPSIIRTSLAAIPALENCHFVDIGCGKGRALIIATEFDFRAITGIEFSPTLARFAWRHAAACARRHPQRTAVNVVCGDALQWKLPDDSLVVFLYNPFGRPLIAQLLARIEASLRETQRDLYIIYYNPAWAEVFDGSAHLERRYAAQLPYARTELGYGPDESDAVIIWQNRGNRHPLPPGLASAAVRIVVPGIRAEIA